MLTNKLWPCYHRSFLDFTLTYCWFPSVRRNSRACSVTQQETRHIDCLKIWKAVKSIDILQQNWPSIIFFSAKRTKNLIHNIIHIVFLQKTVLLKSNSGILVFVIINPLNNFKNSLHLRVFLVSVYQKKVNTLVIQLNDTILSNS